MFLFFNFFLLLNIKFYKKILKQYAKLWQMNTLDSCYLGHFNWGSHLFGTKCQKPNLKNP